MKLLDQVKLLVVLQSIEQPQSIMGHIGDKKRTSRNQDNLVSVPEYLRNFIEGISLKTDEAEPQRKPKQIKEVENESNPAQKLNKNKVCNIW